MKITKENKLISIISLVCGVLSIFLFPIPIAIIGIILGCRIMNRDEPFGIYIVINNVIIGSVGVLTGCIGSVGLFSSAVMGIIGGSALVGYYVGYDLIWYYYTHYSSGNPTMYMVTPAMFLMLLMAIINSFIYLKKKI